MADLKESQALSNQKAEEFEIFQDDDEFEEFEEGTKGRIEVPEFIKGRFLTKKSIGAGIDWGKNEEEKDDTLWDADWDDADVTDDFAKQLRFVTPNFESVGSFCA